jgi:hypothetical protein
MIKLKANPQIFTADLYPENINLSESNNVPLGSFIFITELVKSKEKKENIRI